MSIQDSIQTSGANTSKVSNHHVAVRVSNLERAAEFFIAALGADWLSPPLPIDQGACHYLFDGPPDGQARFAFVGFESPDQPAFELIEFVEPAVPTVTSNSWQDSFMHVCFHIRDVEGTLAKVMAAGGQQFRDVKRFGSGSAELVQAYFRDLDGNLFQMLSLPNSEVMEVLKLQAAQA